MKCVCDQDKCLNKAGCSPYPWSNYAEFTVFAIASGDSTTDRSILLVLIRFQGLTYGVPVGPASSFSTKSRK